MLGSPIRLPWGWPSEGSGDLRLSPAGLSWNSAETGASSSGTAAACPRAFTSLAPSVLARQHRAERCLAGSGVPTQVLHLFPAGRMRAHTHTFNGISFFPECCQDVSGLPAAFGAPGSRGEPAESEDAAAACAALAHRWAARRTLLSPGLGAAASETGCLCVSLRETQLPAWLPGPEGSELGQLFQEPASPHSLAWPCANLCQRQCPCAYLYSPLLCHSFLKAAATSAPCAPPLPGTGVRFPPLPRVCRGTPAALECRALSAVFQAFLLPSDLPEGGLCRLLPPPPPSQHLSAADD